MIDMPVINQLRITSGGAGQTLTMAARKNKFVRSPKKNQLPMHSWLKSVTNKLCKNRSRYTTRDASEPRELTTTHCISGSDVLMCSYHGSTADLGTGHCQILHC